MSLTKAPKRHRYPVSIISEVIWLYHRFNHSLRDVKEPQMRQYRWDLPNHALTSLEGNTKEGKGRKGTQRSKEAKRTGEPDTVASVDKGISQG